MELSRFEIFKLKHYLRTGNAELIISKAIEREYAEFISLAIEIRGMMVNTPALDPALTFLAQQLNDAENVICILGKAKHYDYTDWAYKLAPFLQMVKSTIAEEIIEAYDVDSISTPRYHSKFLRPNKSSEKMEIEAMIAEYDLKFKIIPPEYFDALKVFYNAEMEKEVQE